MTKSFEHILTRKGKKSNYDITKILISNYRIDKAPLIVNISIFIFFDFRVSSFVQFMFPNVIRYTLTLKKFNIIKSTEFGMVKHNSFGNK